LPVKKAVTPYLEVTGTTAAYASVNLVARVAGYLKSINYVDGARVKSGDLLFEIEPEPYEAQVQAAEASVLGAQAQLTQSEAEFQRQNTLFSRQVTDQATLDKARAKRDSDKAALLSSQANLQSARINLSYTRVVAPFDGIVGRHLASLGELVGPGGRTQLASIDQLDPIYVMFNVSDQDVAKYRAEHIRKISSPSELAQIPVEVGLTNEEGYPHRGQLDYVAPTLDTQTATLLLRGRLSNPNRDLLPGMFARVRLPVASPNPDTLLVPDRVIQQNQQGRYVLVVGKNNEVEQRIVQLGQQDQGLRVIVSGITAEDRVVISPLDRAIPGRKINPQLITAGGSVDGPATASR